MIGEKKILEFYKSIAFTRCDDTGVAKYFSHEDFDALCCKAVEFESSKGHKLAGKEYFYEGYNPKRLIVFEHGIGGGHRSYMREIELLCRHGYRVFAYDHTGCMESGGENTGGMAQSLCDLNDCMNFIKKNDEYRNLDFSVIGHSWGGFSALNITALHPEISHIVVLSGFVSVEKLVEGYLGKMLKGCKNSFLDTEKASNPDFVGYDAAETLKNTKAKCLLIYSENDPVVKKMHYELLKDALAGRDNVEFLLESNKGHNPNYTHDAVEYLFDYTMAVRKKLKRNLLDTAQRKREFVSQYDWHRMTSQDEKVWNRIFDFLDK